MTPGQPAAPSSNRTLIIVLVIVGLAGMCLVGSCLFVGLVGLTSDQDPASTAASPPDPPDEPDDSASGEDHPYLCSATAMVRTCTGPNQCSYRYATGSGVGDTMEESKQMAMTACRGSVGAMGGSAPCTVTCNRKK